MSSKPVQTFRLEEGDRSIGVSVWERRGEERTFYEFTVSRAWKRADGEEGYARSFSERNEEAIVSLVQDACYWIRSQQQDALDKAA